MKVGNEFRIGLWTIISIAIVVLGIKYLKGQLHTTTTYYMLSTDVEGLAESSHVKYKGYKIGVVRALDYNYQKDYVVVELNIDPDLRIPADTRAFIEGDILNASSVVLELGSGSRYLMPGDTLFCGGMKPGLLDQAGPMMQSVSNLMPKVDSLLTGLNNVIYDSKLQETLLEVNVLTLQLHRTMSELNSQLPQILDNVNDASANIDTLSMQLREARIEEVIANANNTLANIDSLILAIQSTDGTAGRLISSDELHEQLTSTIADVDSLVNDIKQHPKRYINIKLFGK